MPRQFSKKPTERPRYLAEVVETAIHSPCFRLALQRGDQVLGTGASLIISPGRANLRIRLSAQSAYRGATEADRPEGWLQSLAAY